MGLSCCRPCGTTGRENPTVVIWKKPAAVTPANPKTDAENEVERTPADTRCQERLSADAPRFAATDWCACSLAVVVPGRAVSAPNPNFAASRAATGRWFPRQMTTAVFQQRLWSKVLPALPPATATPAKPSTCDVAKPRLGQWKMFSRSHHVARDWNNTPAGLGQFLLQRCGHHCPKPGYAGSNCRRSRNGDTATA